MFYLPYPLGARHEWRSSRWGRAGEYVLSPVSGDASEVRAAKLLVVLQAYVDDSTSMGGDQRLFLAGYINTAEKWARFSNAWQMELRRPPAIDYLKMSEANSLGGQFKGWSIPDKDRKIEDLARIIRHFKPASIHASVSCLDVAKIIKPVAPYGFSSPYFYCFQAAMIPLAIRQANESIRVPINFIFDDQEGLGEEAKYYYKLIRNEQANNIRDLLPVEPLFRSDKLVLPLQAADILAWHIRREWERDPNAFPVPDMLSADGLHSGLDIDAEQLTRFAVGFAQIPGLLPYRDKSPWKKMTKHVKVLLAAGFVPPYGSHWKNFVQRVRERVAGLFRR